MAAAVHHHAAGGGRAHAAGRRDARQGRLDRKTFETAESCVQDLGTLDGEHVQAAEQLMESLAATERDLRVAEERR